MIIFAKDNKFSIIMADKSNIKNQISDILPNRGSTINYEMSTEREKILEEAVSTEEKRLTAREIAQAKYKEQAQLKKLEERIKNPETRLTPKQQERLKEKRENIELLESIDMSEPVISVPEKAIPLLGTTRPEVTRLLTSLNINLNLNLTKADTYNLLSCLLTCNEQQLNALMSNKKIPIAVKTVIKRLLEDAKLGNIETVEKLWDRVFGKADKMTLEMPQQTTQVMNGIIPNTIVSREAYTIIKETIIGKD